MSFCLDIYIVNKLASFLEYLPGLNLDYPNTKDSVNHFRDIMFPQLDLRVAASNLQRFCQDFERGVSNCLSGEADELHFPRSGMDTLLEVWWWIRPRSIRL